MAGRDEEDDIGIDDELPREFEIDMDIDMDIDEEEDDDIDEDDVLDAATFMEDLGAAEREPMGDHHDPMDQRLFSGRRPSFDLLDEEGWSSGF
ncbi:MAG: hypothetical protein UV82_C0016G0029 [Candidatus Magasanikbacteria bacterium GW2011_GWD2_43_18]|uniref:Uncharacterized protein n=1 Tax=Candidatus Magasanikbacteria bacterium GW2011_GWE2_42_7 TaxID=1619052 RepID=A0A0G1BEF2_9BACT|nr:MAG: hypothetical protein UV18_C0004G0054 [Candidatus Magasanikbacteria bacterium GW2011_GWC2_42_27]KKS71750.1 MAG: hypothetical protein UV42_C0020G0012 [Candidatus Magasanikbacteria bacterium GW2011_GWE2_42_7]KKT03775.1 MAG: hypothetical protein UV82_C0016G0029 [Candidatus Magasanikbacteria bacterium GW2011_GWD2_43_18]KKT25481.1 MAG: hypothetical protein UW10_C0007G0054 [Candidatus Magasanikbacteria bacterium GW2011_GWA2_43_9]HBB38424.1 hypothetical protein [Candidatus Magasanikbacteria bac